MCVRDFARLAWFASSPYFFDDGVFLEFLGSIVIVVLVFGTARFGAAEDSTARSVTLTVNCQPAQEVEGFGLGMVDLSRTNRRLDVSQHLRSHKGCIGSGPETKHVHFQVTKHPVEHFSPRRVRHLGPAQVNHAATEALHFLGWLAIHGQRH